MAVQFKDYYEVLGVERNASNDDLKAAFRRLARQYHPDVNNAPDAEERFKEINEAYAVLSDADRRAAYDRYGHQGVNGQAGGPGFDPTVFAGFEDILGGLGDGQLVGRERQPGAAFAGRPRTIVVSFDAVRAVLNLDDTIFTLKLTPNLAHCLSVYGIAREVAAHGCGVTVAAGDAEGLVAAIKGWTIRIPASIARSTATAWL